MQTRTKLVLIVASTVGVASLALADLPRSWSFANETATRINSTVAEDGNNEKEVEFGDIDLDGDLDMVIAVGSADFGERRNKLYINDGGVFNEVSGTTMIPDFSGEDVSRNVFVRDYTGDDLPDIYIINDSNSGGFAGTDKLYVANWARGALSHFVNEGASRIPNGGDLGAACGGVSFDMDGNGTIDVYSGNYPGPSQDVGMYNDGTGVLANLTGTLVPADGDYTVDVASADMNGDGKIDLIISNDEDPSYVYYNDNLGAGSGLGDFRYTGSTQNLGTAAARENAMEPADFDGDGDMDLYWTNEASGTGDRILRNDGNDGSNKAILVNFNPLPSVVTSNTSRKASVADFNEDDKIDVYVASQAGTRPTVLRNTSVNGAMSFVDWTPAPAIPGSAFHGWHGGVADTNGDGDVDIVVGAFSGDHLLENVRANEVTEASIGGVLPAFFGGEPVAVFGDAVSVRDTYAANGLSSGFISVVLNGPDDYLLEVVNGGGTVVASSDRGGLGVEEALQLSVSNGDYSIRVSVLESSCVAPDFDGDCIVGFTDLVEILSNWGCRGCPTDLDGGGTGFTDLVILLSDWGPVPSDYLLEVLGR